MLYHRPRFAGLLIILAALVFAPSSLAAAPAKGPGAAKGKERVYGKHCGAKRAGAGRHAQRAKCLEAMSKLATGKSSSPRAACRALSRKKGSGGRRSAFARCVAAGAKLLKSKSRGKRDSATHDEGNEPDDSNGDDGDAADSHDDPDDLDAVLDAVDPGDSPADTDPAAADPDADPEA